MSWKDKAEPLESRSESVTTSWKGKAERVDAPRGLEIAEPATPEPTRGDDQKSRDDSGPGLNMARGAAQRGGQLLSGLFTTADAVADFADENAPLGGLTWEDGILPEYKNPEEYREWRKKQGGDEPLETASDYWDEADSGYEPTHTWKEVKRKFSEKGAVSSDAWGEVLAYGAEQGIKSTPDMVAATLNLPGYVLSRSGEIGKERAKNKGKESADITDVAEASPFALGASILERIGAKGITSAGAEQVGKEALKSGVKNVAKEGGKAGGTEAATEFLQEGIIEYVGEKYGTNAQMSLAEAFDRGAAGAVAGGVYGAAGGGTSATAREVMGSGGQVRGDQGKDEDESEAGNDRHDLQTQPATEAESIDSESETPESAETGMAADDLSPYERNTLRDSGVSDDRLWDMPTDQAREILEDQPSQRGTLAQQYANRETGEDESAVVFQQDGVTVRERDGDQPFEASTDDGQFSVRGSSSFDARRKLNQQIESNRERDPILQNRDRSRPDYVAQMQSIAENPDYDRVSVSREPNSGAPMVFDRGSTDSIPEQDLGRTETITMDDGQGESRKIPAQYAVVEADQVAASNQADGSRNEDYGSGGLTALNNGRTAGLQSAFRNGNAGEYTDSLKADEAHGVSREAIENKDKPMLVRRFDEASLEGIEDPGAASNVSTSAELSASEQANTDARKLDTDILAQAQPGPLDGAANRDFVRSFIDAVGGAGQNNRLIDQDGLLTQDGKKRAQGALVARAFGDDALTQEITEATDSDLKTLGDALSDVAGRWALMRDRARDSAINPDMDITEALRSSVNMIRKARQEGRALSDLAGQVDAFAGETDQAAKQLLSLFYRGQRYTSIRGRETITNTLNGYLDSALASAPEPDMFGQMTTPQQALEAQSGEQEAQAQSQQEPAEQQTSGLQPDGRKAEGAGAQGERSGSRASREEPGETGEQQSQVGPDEQALESAAARPETDPSDAQKEAGNYRKGHLNFQGLDVTIENPRGSTRSGTDPDGSQWESEMAHHYGYIKRSEGADGDHVDVFIGPDTESDQVFVIDQQDADGTFDEHKIMLGFQNQQAARDGYVANYEEGWQVGPITRMGMDEFKQWLKDGDTAQPMAQPDPDSREDDGGQEPAQEVAASRPGAPETEKGAMPKSVGVGPSSITPRPIGGKLYRETSMEGLTDLLRGTLANSPERGIVTSVFTADSPDLAIGQGENKGVWVEMDGDYVSGELNQKPGIDVAEGNEYQTDYIHRDAIDRFLIPKDARLKGSTSVFANRHFSVQSRADGSKLFTRKGAAISSEADAFPELGSPERPQTYAPDSPSQEAEQRPPEGQSSAPIEDFGETIAGARKEIMAAYRAKMDEATDLDPEQVPLSKSWPEPNYQKMLDEGVDSWAVSAMRAMRDEVPPKPRRGWKLRGWAKKVRTLRDFAQRLADDPAVAQQVREELEQTQALAPVVGRIDLYQALGHGQSLKGITLSRQQFSRFRGEEDVTKWIISRPAKSNAFGNMPGFMGVGDTKEQAIEDFRSRLNDQGNEKDQSKAVRFDVYSDRTTKEVFIGKKIGKDVVRMSGGFESVDEARRYMQENQSDLEDQLSRMKDVPAHRKESNSPRVGADHRNGGDVTPDAFSETFGFRGVQFGNAVSQSRRQEDLNNAYDALMDMAGVLNIPAKALSLNGNLGLAFGARGKGGKRPAKAHYEPGKVVINLTKRDGAGSLAHEWWHALDNYFSSEDSFASEGNINSETRQQMRQAFNNVTQTINRTRLRQRSQSLDKARTKAYWSTGREMSARSFESYIIEKLEDQNASNDYLANIVSEQYWEAAANLDHQGSYPYPEAAEIEQVRGAFDEFFQTIETRETDQGTAMFSRTGEQEPESIGEIRQGFEELGIQHGIREKNGVITVDKMVVPEDSRNQGLGTEAMNELIRYADNTGQKIALTPSSDFGGNKLRLTRFYRGMGFVSNKGASKDFEISESMVRDPQPTARMRRSGPQDGGPLTADQARSITNDLMRDWKGRPGITVADSINEFPSGLRGAIRRAGAESDMRAAYWSDQIYILAPRIPNRAALEEVILHETVGHYGLRKMLGDELKPTLNKIYLSFANSDRARQIRETYFPDGSFNAGNSNHRMIVAEELLAHMAETGQRPNLLQQAVAKIREGLRRLGFTLDINKSELLSLLRGARRTVENGGFSRPSDADTNFSRQDRPDTANVESEEIAQPDVQEITDESEIERIYAQYGRGAGQGAGQDSGTTVAGRPARQGWQQDTRIRGSRGEPAALFRGSERGLTAADFSTDSFGYASDNPSANLGVFFSSSRSEAQTYGGAEPFYADIRNPYVIEGAELPSFNSSAQAQQYRRSIEQQGYDGIVIDYTDLGGPKHVVPFSAEQVIEPESETSFSRAPQTETQAFRDWFGDSKIVDENGTPKVVYRGTYADTDSEFAFEVGHEGSAGDESSNAFYFTDDRSDAKDYAPGGEVLDAYVSIRNPLDLRTQEGVDRLNEAIEENDLDNDIASGQSPEESLTTENFWVQIEGMGAPNRFLNAVADWAKSENYDGLIFEDAIDGDEHTAYAAFEPEQIKSASENRGSFDPNNPDIRFSRARDSGNKIFEAPTESRFQSLIRTIQDKMNPLKQTQQAIKDAGGRVDESNNAYMAEEAFHGKTEKDLEDVKRRYIEPMTEAMAENDINQEELDVYLIAKHARERNAQIAKINPDMPDGGSGMTDAQADAVLRQAKEEGRSKALDEAAQHVYAMTTKQREILRESGLQSEELTDTWEATYQNYVPLKGWAEDEDNSGFPQTGGGYTIKGKESLRAMGRTTQAASPSATVVSDLTEKIIRHRKNEVGNTLLKLVEDNPNPEYWRVYHADDTHKERGIVEVKDENGNMVEQVRMVAKPMAALADRYFTTKKNGQTYYIDMEDERLMSAMKNMGPESQGAIVRAMGTINRMLSSLVTSYSPEFTVSNFSRDIQTAILNVMAETDLADGRASEAETSRLMRNMVKDVPAAMKSISRDHRGRDDQSDYANFYQEFLEDGAKTGFFDMKDVEEQAKELERMVEMARGGAKGNALKFGKSVAEFVENANSTVENGVRLTVYKNARDAGVSRKKAASLAKNLTVNFNRKGEIGTALNALYMFTNASIQGTAQFARVMGTLNIDPETGERSLNKAQKTAMGLVGASFALAIINRDMGGQDDDGEDWYDKIPDYERERNLILMKSLFGGEQDGSYWKIPLPYGYNVFHVLGDNMQSVVSGNRDLSKASTEMVMAMAGSFSPIGLESSEDTSKLAAKTLTPTIGKPFVQLAVNETFYGAPIYRENFEFGVQKPDSELVRKSTKEHWEAVAQWMNQATGGTGNRPGIVDINPDSLDHLFSFFTGGAGAFVSRSADYAQSTVTGEEIETRSVPFRRKLDGQVSDYDDINQFYERQVELEQIAQDVKDAEGSDRLRLSREYRDELQLERMANSVAQDLKDLRKQRDGIKSSAMDENRKEERLDIIKQRMDTLVDRFNKRYNNTRYQ